MIIYYIIVVVENYFTYQLYYRSLNLIVGGDALDLTYLGGEGGVLGLMTDFQHADFSDLP